eukprot:Skav200934  [mRNA]  locus=scaffold2433:424506:432670:+ [translate_table: standard]
MVGDDRRVKEGFIAIDGSRVAAEGLGTMGCGAVKGAVKSAPQAEDVSSVEERRGDAEHKRKDKRRKKDRRSRSKAKKERKNKEKRRRCSSSSKHGKTRKVLASKSGKRRSSSNLSRIRNTSPPKNFSPEMEPAPEKRRRKGQVEAAALPKPIAPVKGPESELGLNSSDQESESCEPVAIEEQALKQWHAADAANVCKEVAAGLANIDSKPKRLSLSAILELLGNIPEDVLKVESLIKARDDLKKLERLLRKDKVMPLLQKMEALCAKRQSIEEDDEPLATVTVSIHRMGGASRIRRWRGIGGKSRNPGGSEGRGHSGRCAKSFLPGTRLQ